MARRERLKDARTIDKPTPIPEESPLSKPTFIATPSAPEEGDAAPAGRTTLADLLRLFDPDAPNRPEAGDEAARTAVSMRRVKAGANLIRMGAPAMALYFVRTGTFKISRVDEDGYEQVLAFAGRGEVIAYEAICQDAYPTNAVALEDATAYVVPKADLANFCRAVPAFEMALHRAASAALVRTNDLVDVMAAVSSEVRLARFLLQLSRKMAQAGQSPRRFILRMGRRDIASLLGVAHETVSRSFGSLAMARVLHVDDRDVEILDLDALRAYARCTRRAHEDPMAPRPGRLAAAPHRMPGRQSLAA
jgi:CRP/FNR family transcriptional regulator